MKTATLSFLLFVVLTGPAPAATFICDPVHGNAQGDGSAARPWGALEEVVAHKLLQLPDAQGAPANPQAPVGSGDTLLLRSGWHGVLRVRGGYHDEFLTIAADAGHRPAVGWVSIGAGRRWRVSGLAVSPSLAPAALPKMPRNLVQLGEHGDEATAELVVEDCFIYSVPDTSAWSARDWVDKPAGGIWLGRHGRGHVARNNYVLNTRFGISLCAPDVVCEGNVVAHFSADGIRVTRDRQVVRHNVIKNNFVGAGDGDDNHDDGIQAFLFNRGSGTLRDAVIQDNIIVARETDGLPFPNPLQGIGFFDGPLLDFTVEGNAVLANHYHGVSLYDAQGCTIRNNVCYSRWPEQKLKPWVMLGQKRQSARGNTVTGNLAHSFNFRADPEVRAEGNEEIDEAVFYRRLRSLAGRIDETYGRVHPVAQRRRLEIAGP